MTSEKTTITVDRKTLEKATKFAGLLQLKKGEPVSAGEAVEAALDRCLKEVA